MDEQAQLAKREVELDPESTIAKYRAAGRQERQLQRPEGTPRCPECRLWVTMEALLETTGGRHDTEGARFSAGCFMVTLWRCTICGSVAHGTKKMTSEEQRIWGLSGGEFEMPSNSEAGNIGTGALTMLNGRRVPGRPPEELSQDVLAARAAYEVCDTCEHTRGFHCSLIDNLLCRANRPGGQGGDPCDCDGFVLRPTFRITARDAGGEGG